MTYPPVVSREKWLVARNGLLAKEKEFTMARNQLNADHIDRPAVTELVNELTRPLAPAATCRIRVEHAAIQLEKGTDAEQSPPRSLLQGRPVSTISGSLRRRICTARRMCSMPVGRALHRVPLFFGLFWREPGATTKKGEP
jgi:hypothetical protein